MQSLTAPSRSTDEPPDTGTRSHARKSRAAGTSMRLSVLRISACPTSPHTKSVIRPQRGSLSPQTWAAPLPISLPPLNCADGLALTSTPLV